MTTRENTTTRNIVPDVTVVFCDWVEKIAVKSNGTFSSTRLMRVRDGAVAMCTFSCLNHDSNVKDALMTAHQMFGDFATKRELDYDVNIQRTIDERNLPTTRFLFTVGRAA